jgi:hypothetical protein
MPVVEKNSTNDDTNDDTEDTNDTSDTGDMTKATKNHNAYHSVSADEHSNGWSCACKISDGSTLSTEMWL